VDNVPDPLALGIEQNNQVYTEDVYCGGAERIGRRGREKGARATTCILKIGMNGDNIP